MKPQTIVFNPEIAHAALKAKVTDICFIYLMSKSHNRSHYNNNGLFTKSEFLSIIRELLNVGKQQSYNKLEKGNGIFWKDHGKGKVQLVSFEKIISYLSPTLIKSKPIIFEIEDLLEVNWNTSTIQSFFIGLVAARFTGERPISFKEISKSCNLSESTIKRGLNNCPYLYSTSNHKTLFQSYSSKKAQEFKDQLQFISFIVLNNQGIYEVKKQMANSYKFHIGRHLSFKKRNKHIKRLDEFNSPKSNDTFKPWNSQFVKVMFDSKGQRINAWKDTELIIPVKKKYRICS